MLIKRFVRGLGKDNENYLVFPLVERKIHSKIIIVAVHVYCELTGHRYFRELSVFLQLFLITKLRRNCYVFLCLTDDEF